MDLWNQSAATEEFSLTKDNMPIVQQLAEKIPGGFFVYQESGHRELLFVNHIVLDIFGCKTLEEFYELTGGTFEGMVHPEDFEAIQSSIDQQIEADKEDQLDYVSYRIIRKDGSIRWVDDYGHFSRSKDFGDIYYVFLNDITEKHEAELEIARRAEVIDGLSIEYDSIYLLDLDTNEVYPYRLNSPYYKDIQKEISAKGHAAEPMDWADMSAVYADRYVLPEDRLLYMEGVSEHMIRMHLKKGMSYNMSYRLHGEDGQIKYMRMMVVRLEDAQQSNYAVIGYRDITNQMEQMRWTTESSNLAQRALEERNAALSMLSHDIGTPVSAMTTFCQMAMTHLDQQPLVEKYLTHAEETSLHLMALVDELQDVSWRRAEATEPQLAECNLKEEMESIKGMLSLMADTKQLALAMEMPDESAYLDVCAFRRIMINLLENAIKFTPQHGSVTVTAEHREADAETGEECYVFQVADNGVGMSEDALEKLLRSLQTGTREAMEEGGTVYGLSIVKSLLERMGGSILLASKQGEGTIFTVKIPSRKAGK
ncbi:MAG: PAS domain-containing protein [Selenomonadaceae bacterium]|nr:PAS domain-containing protein [Selenomonadaceae bacterium]